MSALGFELVEADWIGLVRLLICGSLLLPTHSYPEIYCWSGIYMGVQNHTTSTLRE